MLNFKGVITNHIQPYSDIQWLDSNLQMPAKTPANVLAGDLFLTRCDLESGDENRKWPLNKDEKGHKLNHLLRVLHPQS